jgi:pyruvate dehydrogenase E2 component (dihydrolipoamide acetyltransferase)
VRRVIARRLTEAARDIPHFTVTMAARMDALEAMRAQINEHTVKAGRRKVSVNDLIIKAAGQALRTHPEVNASYVDDSSPFMLRHGRVNVGMAVASEHGLVVPVIMDADAKSVGAISGEARDLVALAGAHRLAPEQLSGGTFTVSNLGMFGVEEFTAIINPPEAAILAVGGIKNELVLDQGKVVARRTMRLTLSADHRVVDGALGAQFMRTVCTLLENPWSLLL